MKRFIFIVFLMFSVSAEDVVNKIIKTLQEGNYKERSAVIKEIPKLSDDDRKKLSQILKASKDPELKRIYQKHFEIEKLLPFEKLCKTFFEKKKKDRNDVIEFLSKCLTSEKHIKILRKYDAKGHYVSYLIQNQLNVDQKGLETRFYATEEITQQELVKVGILIGDGTRFKYAHNAKRLVATMPIGQHKKLEIFLRILNEL